MKQALYIAGLGAMLATAAFAQELTIGSPMPDPAKRGGYFFDNPIQIWGQYNCIIQINRYTDAQRKKITFLSAFPDMDWEKKDKPYMIVDGVANKVFIDQDRDGSIDEIVDAPANTLELALGKHPYCKRTDSPKQ